MKNDTDSLRLRPEGLAVTGALLAVGQLAAQTSAPAEKKKEEGTQTNENLSEVVVNADKEKELYKPERLQSPKYTQPLRDVAKTITVIPSEVIKEQNATNLRDVLRNVPGISMQAGEGGGGPAGDNLSIRGFAARSDIFVDGMRDTASGGYARDPFVFEQVEVSKGPGSTTTGRGSTGGSINIETKTPFADNAYDITLGGGTDNFMRGTLDLNQQIPGLNGAAVRLNALYHDQDIPGREGVENERWGVAPSIAFGLNTDTRFTLSYMHLDQDNTPDYGIPWVPLNSTTNPFLIPGVVPPVSFDTWYGNDLRDYEKIKTDIVTGIFEHDFNDCLTLRSAFRYGLNDRDSITSAPRFAAINDTTPGTIPRTTTLNQQFQSRLQTDRAVFNQTDINWEFETGSVEHSLVTGFEIGREESRNLGRAMELGAGSTTPGVVAPNPQTDLFRPNNYVPYLGSLVYNGSFTETISDTAALFLFDTIKFNEQWQFTGGLRWDNYDVNYRTRTADVTNTAGVTTGGVLTDLSRDDSMVSWQAALDYKPVEEGTIYLAYGTSFNPATENLTYIAAPTATNNTLSLFNADPEENETIEFGVKWEFFDERLLVNSAVFRTEKTNARTTDPADPTIVTLTGEQVVEGFEFGFTGSITDTWRLIGGYTYLSSEVEKSSVTQEVGAELSNTPEHSFSLWTVHDLPKGFQVGLGTQFVDSRFNNNNVTTRQEAPSFVLFNAMAGYRVNDNLAFRLNVDNIADESYIDKVGGGHFIPGQGRSLILSADMTF